MSEKSELKKAIGHISSWGLQTIMFAMSLRAERVGNPIDGLGRVTAAGGEAKAIVQELWEAAFSECDQPVQPSQMTMKFAAKVFDWVINHLAE